MLPNKSVCSNSSLFDIFQPVLFGQCYGVILRIVNEEERYKDDDGHPLGLGI